MKYTIPDTKVYLSEMKKAINKKDKLWFLKYIWIESMFDIGCADGGIIKTLDKQFNHHFRAIGYDPNPNLIYHANSESTHIEFTDDYQEAIKLSKKIAPVDVTLLSTVLHEVYSRKDRREILDLFNLVREVNADHVVIRDMYYPHGNMSTPKDIMEAINKHAPPHKLNDFRNYRHPSNFRNALEFLLKYRYSTNWEYEMKEDYFSLDLDEVDYNLRLLGYEQAYQRKFIPTFIKRKIKMDFRIEVPTTHIEIIYTKKNKL